MWISGLIGWDFIPGFITSFNQIIPRGLPRGFLIFSPGLGELSDKSLTER